jgi:hypothetical protein
MDGASMDTITIRIPRESGFKTVADLVVGGVAARHDVTLEVLDDLQLALDSLLEHEEEDEGEVTIVLRMAGDSIDVALGPVGANVVAELQQEAGEGIGLRRLLDTTVDGVSLTTRDGESWVELTKGHALAGADG